jgi:hypothetical protein
MHPLYVLETECKANLIKILKASLGPERVLELKDAGFVELDISPREIVEAMMRIHAVFDLDDVTLLRKPLLTPLDKAENFISHSNARRSRMTLLADPVVNGSHSSDGNYVHFRHSLSPHHEALKTCFAIHDGTHPTRASKTVTSHIVCLTTMLPAAKQPTNNLFLGSAAFHPVCLPPPPLLPRPSPPR